MHQKHVLLKGRKLGEAEKVLVMLHGRGANAEDILSLADYLKVSDFTLLAPQATGNTWYPNSFLAPPYTNEPWLSSAISLIDDITDDINNSGIDDTNIFYLGFSQGACLTLEYVTRNATKYGGVVAFTGGLIGDKIYEQNYSGDFELTPVFIGTSDPDPHVPVQRIQDSVKILRGMNAQVTEKIYKNMGHTINEDEIEIVNNVIFNL
jgi:phospholipase/carboxylesterase